MYLCYRYVSVLYIYIHIIYCYIIYILYYIYRERGKLVLSTALRNLIEQYHFLKPQSLLYLSLFIKDKYTMS